MTARFRLFVVLACLSLVSATAHAQGHLLHGIGPVNGAMGGAGTALVEDSLGALTFNPALIAGVEGNQLSFATEFFKDSPRIDTTINLPGVGTASGSAAGSREIVIYPAFGWMSRPPDKKLAIGFGLIGIGGFRTDYPQNSASILFGQPPQGFGRVFSDYRLTKIPLALAYRVTPRFWIGASLNVYYAEYAQSPLPHDVFDVGTQGIFYPSAGNMSGSFAVGGQLGFVYQATNGLSLAASVTSPQNFQKFEWNSTIVDPGAVTYGRPRTLTADVDGPMIVSFGASLKLGSRAQFAFDETFTKFKGVHGFGSPGGIVDGMINPFGWRNVWTFKAGLQLRPTDKLTLRMGYNYNQTPIRADVVLTAGTPSPVTFEQHFCGGLGLQLFPFASAEAAVYYVPRKHVSGPFPTVQGFDIGTVDISNEVTSAQVGLSFKF